MNLIDAIKKVELKDKERNKILGQKEMLIESLKELGFDTTIDAEKASADMQKVVDKMNKNYENGETKFKKDFSHLLR